MEGNDVSAKITRSTVFVCNERREYRSVYENEKKKIR